MENSSVNNPELRKKTLSGFAWQFASSILQAVLQLIVLAILSRLLTPEDFGVLGFAMIFVGFAALFSQLGVGPALIQRNELTPIHIRVGFTLSVLLSLILMIITMAAAPWAAIFLKNEQVTDVLFVVSLNFFFTGFGVVSESLMKRNLQFKGLMWANVGSYLVGYAFIGITLAWLGFGVLALVGATLGQSLVKSVLLLVLRPHPLTPSFSLKEIRELLYFGGGFTLAHFLNYSANQGDYFVVGKILGTEALGIYSRAYQLMMMPAKYFSQVLSVVLFPVMAKMQEDRPKLTNTYLMGVALVALVSAPLGALMIVTAPEIVAVLLGSQWTESILPFQILSLGVVARGAYKVDDALARALGSMYRRSLRDVIYAVAVVVGTWLGLRWGLAGVAVGVLGAVVINSLLALRMSMQLLDCPWSLVAKALSPTIIPTGIVAFVAVFVRAFFISQSLPAWFTLGATTFICGLILFVVFIFQPQMLGSYGTKALKRFLPLMPTQFFPKSFSQWLLAKINE